MKRLNMVLSELERATQEKSEINARLLEQDRMADVRVQVLNYIGIETEAR